MLKSHPRALYLTWLMLLLVLPLPMVIMLNTSLLETDGNLFLYDAGIVAYVWWLAIVYLSTRPQWLDRLIGLPAMYFIHGMLGVLALAAAFIHRQFSFSMHDNIKLTGDWAWYLAVFGILYAIFFLSGWLVDRFPLAYRIKQHLQFFFRHELSIWVHRLNFVMIFLIWLHVHVINRIAILTPFMMLFDLYTVGFLAAYVWKKYVADKEEVTRGVLLSSQAVSDTVQEIAIQVPERHSYQAGDFYFIRFESSTVSKEVHPFSVASAPSRDGREIRFVIQSVGDFTSRLPQLPVGTQVLMEGPFGRFAPIVSEQPKERPIVLYGLGSGIAPMKSMAREYAGTRSIHIIWSAKNEVGMYFQEEFEELAAAYPQVRYHGKAHRFSNQELESILSPEEISQALFFVVGSAQALLRVEHNLQTISVPKRNIHDERLTM